MSTNAPETPSATPAKSIVRRFWFTVAWASALLIAAMGAAPLVGPFDIDIVGALTGRAPVDARILLTARLPRVLMAGMAGAVLSAAGMAFQALLRNPLAEPFTLGVSSGASMGAALSILLGINFTVAGFGAVPIFALAGALCGLLLGFGLAVVADFLDPSIKDVEELRMALPYPVLAVIPYVKPRDQRRLAAVSPDDTQPESSGRRKVGRRSSRAIPFRRAGGGGNA